MDCRLPGCPVHGILRQKYWSGLPFPSPVIKHTSKQNWVSITQQGSKQGKEMLGNNRCLAYYLKLGKEASDKMVLGRELSDTKWGTAMWGCWGTLHIVGLKNYNYPENYYYSQVTDKQCQVLQGKVTCPRSWNWWISAVIWIQVSLTPKPCFLPNPWSCFQTALGGWKKENQMTLKLLVLLLHPGKLPGASSIRSSSSDLDSNVQWLQGSHLCWAARETPCPSS